MKTISAEICPAGLDQDSSGPFRPIDTSAVMPSPALRRWYRRVQPAAEALFGFPELWRHYDAISADRPDAPTFAEALMQRLAVGWEISEEDLDALRKVSGPLILLSNHPFGGADSLALVRLLEAIRPEKWRILSNRVVCSIPELRDRLIQVDPLSSAGESAALNRRGLVNALRHLRSDGVLGLFPAGRVSYRDPKSKTITDRPWSDHPARLAAAAGASIAVLHIPGQNSSSFLRIPPRWSRLRALMLCRELTRPSETTVRLRLAALFSPVAAQRLAAKPGSGAKLRAWCFLRADVGISRPKSSPAFSVVTDPIAPPAESSALVRATKELRSSRLVISSGKFDIFLVRGEEAPVLLHELGRIREITFRAAGQGTGRTLDLAPEDQYYHHLLMWDREAGRLAGAYRIGIVQDVLKSHGPGGLYLDHVFKIRLLFYQKLGPAFELSRSFVLPEYQRDNQALAALWKGLGHAAVKQGVETLFGSVTISNSHHPASRGLLVEHLRRNYADTPELRNLVRARQPFAPTSRYHAQIADAYRGEPIDALAGMIERLEEGRRGIPPLMRYYCGLGAKFLAYHVEASFADALYCLLRVDLHAMPPAYRRRFLGT